MGLSCSQAIYEDIKQKLLKPRMQYQGKHIIGFSFHISLKRKKKSKTPQTSFKIGG
jgi:hypothetical protein